MVKNSFSIYSFFTIQYFGPERLTYTSSTCTHRVDPGTAFEMCRRNPSLEVLSCRRAPHR